MPLWRMTWLVLGLLHAGLAQALTPDQASRIATGDSDARIEALDAAANDPALPAYVQALLADEVKLVPGNAPRALIVHEGRAIDAATGAAAKLPDDAEDVVNNNRMRRALEAMAAALALRSPDPSARQRAVAALAEGIDASRLPLIEQALAAEQDESIKASLARRRPPALRPAPEASPPLAAVQSLATTADPSVRALLLERLPDEPDAAVKVALQTALRQIESRLAWGEYLGVLFTGTSLGSILILVALGLAVTYGLMGVINMAHGELMMIGAYTTYAVQNLFRAHLPAGAFDLYIVAAVPAAFAVSAAVGAAMERGVIRWLYGRPLETLLATWGISLILMQAVRSLFGAQNVAVENPSWLSGGLQVLPNLTLPYNRLAILAFMAAVLAGMSWLISRTRLGLLVRGVTQNRRMAACVGVATTRVDTWAFALGSGIAGLAGCALSQVGNVGPDLGQGYIVDAFMVVVTGGVGQLAGTVYAGFGLGVLNKLLEGWQGAVLAKITVLVMIVMFIQKRPQGLFALKGRSAEA